MEQLFLVSFTFKTGEGQYTEHRMLEASDKEQGYAVFNEWFPQEYPGSEIVSVIISGVINNQIKGIDSK